MELANLSTEDKAEGQDAADSLHHLEPADGRHAKAF